MRKAVGVTRLVVFKNIKTGATAGIGGSCPWYSDEDKANWRTEVKGWVPVWRDGTNGWLRPPFKTEEEANEWLNGNRYVNDH